VDNAFQLALTTDPLADSGEEDEDARCDYSELCKDAMVPITILNCVFFSHTSIPVTCREPAARACSNARD
jgi:hypothetical protein